MPIFIAQSLKIFNQSTHHCRQTPQPRKALPKQPIRLLRDSAGRGACLRKRQLTLFPCRFPPRLFSLSCEQGSLVNYSPSLSPGLFRLQGFGLSARVVSSDSIPPSRRRSRKLCLSPTLAVADVKLLEALRLLLLICYYMEFGRKD
jgi:hypothetical protein